MPAILLNEGKSLLKATIQKDLKHIDYKRVCKIAKEYHAYVTGEDIKSLLKQFVPRESIELFDQRVAITSLTTPDIANTLATPMYKVGRTTASSTIVWKNKDETLKKRSELLEVSNKFWGDASVDKYLTYRMPSMDLTDPNSFIVVEFQEAVDPKDPNTKANPYPFEVNSTEAIDYKYLNNELQYLTVLNTDGGKDHNNYTLYLSDDSIVAIQITKEQLPDIQAQFPAAEIWYKDEKNKENSPIFYVLTYSHKAGRVPARRVGTIRDEETRQRTCVPMIHPAKCYFEKAIKTVSEFDITNALHTFPKVFRYGNKCPGDMKRGILCDNGVYINRENVEAENGKDNLDGFVSHCPICKGSGWSNQTTTASEVIVAAPKEMKDMVSLDLMMTYKAPPADLLEFQKTYGLYELKELAIKAVYNGNTYVSDSVVKTATQSNIDYDSVYDTLTPFADNWSGMWIHIMTLIATYRDLAKDLTINHSFPKDFKMKSLSELLIDLRSASDTWVPSYVKKTITHDIAKKIYIDQPSELLKIQTKEKFFPFNGKSETEVNYILANGLVTNFDKTFYAKFDQIFDQIEQEQALNDLDLYNMEYAKQQQLIADKVNNYIALLDSDNAAARAIAFNGTGAPVGSPGTRYNEGDMVTITSGKELIPTDAGVQFKIDAINGTSVDLLYPDETSVTYPLNSLA